MTDTATSRRKRKIEVKVSPWKGHPSYRWRVSFPEEGKRRSKGFRKKSGLGGAYEFKAAVEAEIVKAGAMEKPITDAEWDAVKAFRDLVAEIPDGAARPSLREIVEQAGKSLALREKSQSVAVLVNEYLDDVERRGVSETYRYTISKRLGRFVEEYGDWLACDVSRDVLEEWLRELRLSPVSVNHFRAALKQCFGYGKERKVVDENPVDGVKKVKVQSKEPEVLNPQEVAALLEQAPPEIVPGLALGFFAGVRRAELCRMDWSEIDFEEGWVEVKGAKAKGADRRLIPLRENLRDWLRPYASTKGAVMPSEMVWRRRLAEAMERAGVERWPHNAPRHSFASYALAKFQDAAVLALEMGHTNTKMLFTNYRALVTPKAAEAYWSIAPAEDGKVLRMG